MDTYCEETTTALPNKLYSRLETTRPQKNRATTEYFEKRSGVRNGVSMNGGCGSTQELKEKSGL